MSKEKDITGQRFDRLVALYRVDDRVSKSGRKHIVWHCKCDCGNEVDVIKNNLGKTIKSCGCYRKEYMSNKKIKKNHNDLINKKYGRLTVIKIDESYTKRIRYICLCDCGNYKSVDKNRLLNGNTKSCGCYNLECIKKRSKKYNKYDLSGDYGIGWTSNTNKEFYFDLEDYDKIKDYCWREDTVHGYIVASKLNDSDKTISLHRLVMNCDDNKVIDHIKHKVNDNRKSELRMCNQSDNVFNTSIRKDNTTGYTGVKWEKRRKYWYSEIFYLGKNIYLGSFKNKEDAIKARKEAEDKYFGKYSYDNSMKVQ